MTNQFKLRRVVLLMSALGTFGLNQTASASGFFLWEQDAASIGNYHAGVAAIADDASTAWYNPAGLVRIKNQQLVLGADPILTDFRYKGTVGVNTIFDPNTGFTAAPTGAVAQGGQFNIVPFGHYAAPLSDRVVLGFSVDVPFGLQTNYGNTTFTRYAATLTQLQVIDFTPSIGIKLTDQLSVGGGVDFQRLSAELNLETALGTAEFPDNTRSHNAASDWGYGWRLGALYQLTPCTRFGVSYRSKVTHHAKGNSLYVGPLAEDNRQYTRHFHANATLPALTTLSAFHSFNPCWDVLGSVTFTQWNSFQNLILQNVAGINAELLHTENLVVNIANKYQNVWNYALGANYHPSERWIIRTGAGYDQSPSNNKHRNLQIPDSDRVAIALGAHYQVNRALGFDAGWTHLFAMNARIRNTQVFGPEIVTTRGTISGNADVYGLQAKWDII